MPDEPINLPAPETPPQNSPDAASSYADYPDQQLEPAAEAHAEEEQLLNTCAACQGVIDVTGIRPYEKIICPLCDESIRVRTIFDHFTLKSEIGEGGMARVFKANDNSLNREVALKILHSEFFTNPEMTAQFEREARMTASINHPNVVQVFKVGQDQGYFYIAMELLDAQNLEQRIDSHGAIQERTALRLLHETARGLYAAFQTGLLHRDVKPGNVLLDENGHAKLVDFGLALVQGQDEDSLQELWATPFYVPPEKLTGYPEDHRSDIYSLGAAFFHALAGTPPFKNAQTDSIDELISIKAQRSDLRSTAPKLKEPTTTLINSMMAYDPNQRPQNYEALLALIEVVRQEVDPVYAGRSKKNPLTWIALIGGGIAVVAGLIALAVFLFGGDGSKDEPVVIAGGGSASRSGGTGFVVTAEYGNLVKLLDESRLDTKRGDFEAAKTKLTTLLDNLQATPELRAWAGFQSGIVELLQGNKEAASDHFNESRQHAESVAETDRKALGEILSNLASSDPVQVKGLANSTKSDLEAFATLLYGLKNRLQGESNLSLQFLNTYKSSEIPKTSWMFEVGQEIDQIIADISLFKSVPQLDPGAEQEELEKVQQAASEAAEKLKVSPDLADQLRNRAANAGNRLETLVAAAEKVLAEKDTELISQARAEADALAAELNFSAAAEVWKKVEAQSPSGRQQSVSMAEVMGQAAKFFEHFTTNIGTYRYQGQILRRDDKPPFSARIVGANATHLIVDLGFGPTNLDLKTISVDGLLVIAKKTAMQGALTPELSEGAAYFSWICGDEAGAEAMAEELTAIPGFPRRWASLTLPDFQ
ncbi:MAG: serine/threonine protein kinase [Verrucomicrobiales bacterium]|jgi:serine/threonine protein kinase